MNCEECKQLIGAFIDNDLDEAVAGEVRDHIAFCPDCAMVCEDLTSLVDFCKGESASNVVPPNSQAMWCRINNIIESDAKPVAPPQPVPERRSWRVSFLRLSAAVLAIAVISSVVTISVLRSYEPPTDGTLAGTQPQTTLEKLMSKVGLVETPQQARDRRVKERLATIEYWNNRVQARRVQWDARTRDSFDRTLQVIDESMNDYTMLLAQDPDDELSSEMLDAVMDDKMKLLRDFSDL